MNDITTLQTFSTSMDQHLFLAQLPPPTYTLFPYTTLFRSSTPTRWWSTGPTCSDWRSCTSSGAASGAPPSARSRTRSEEHTSELQSRFDLVCRLLLEKKILIIRITQWYQKWLLSHWEFRTS